MSNGILWLNLRLDPGDGLAHNLDTVVNALDREEALCEALADGAVHHEVTIQALALRDFSLCHFESQMLGELSIE